MSRALSYATIYTIHTFRYGFFFAKCDDKAMVDDDDDGLMV